MDHRLVAWARSVKARQRHRLQGGGAALPPLWLFTDERRLPDPCPAVARLPRGLCGVVLRHDGDAGRAALGRRLAAICRQRRLVLVVAGDWRLAAALQAGLHLRGGRHLPGMPRAWPIVTSSAHDRVELRRAARAKADLVFLSPAFATASHPGAAALGPLRWSALAGRARFAVAALGGIDGGTVRRLGRGRCAGAGAIGALNQRT
ncbi:thiamine phosphate synthase [Limobrevibacterium gyesilva]|uniref:Thiamine phosphate synthase n=1 Tax=Limobrevibacterium gyesilva TaxID=2991712 RepID=A0AA41YHR8_9PROT|nr:thiamine phosphate synthase [Limobrevibacterium gyesilva]MCW3473639.1 thiamine phosphate synthase [Limobrevibacterium gyesilva]